MKLNYERGMSVVEVLILTGILVILLIGWLYWYRYFADKSNYTRQVSMFMANPNESWILVLDEKVYNDNKWSLNQAIKAITENDNGWLRFNSWTVTITKWTGAYLWKYIIFK